MLNVIFMGTPDFARDSLRALYEVGHNILAVVTNVDKPKGRGMKLMPSPVKEYALEKNLNLFQPEKIRGNDEFINEIKALKPDIICAVAYGKIIPKEILDIPKYGCVNVHPSLLPKYRGATPIQTAIINGDTVTGVTTLYMNEELDAGDIILQEEINIENHQTTGDIWEIASRVGSELLVETLSKIEIGTAPRISQGNDYIVTQKLDKEMAKINWKSQTAVEISNLIRGLDPIMGAYAILNGKKVKFWKAEPLTIDEFVSRYNEFNNYKERLENESIPGAIVYIDYKEAMYLKANKGILKVTEVQAENAKRMSTPDFLRGNKIETAEIFE